MADTIITAAIGDAVSRVISLLLGHFNQQQSSEAKLATVCHMLIRIHSVVEEAKERQIHNHGTLQWLSELIDAEYQGRYLLDTIECDKNNEQHQHGKVSYVSTTSLFNPSKRVRVGESTMRRLLPWHHDFDVYEIDRVHERLRDMSSDLREFIMLLQSCQQISRPLVTSIFRDGQMFGRHVEKERIINFLLHTRGGSTGKVEVLPIIGDDGTGKTTLVQHACDDARVRRHFAVIMLCCTYTITADRGTPVLRSKLSIGDGGINLNDPMQLFKGQLGDKKFLMVFEDVDMKKMQMLEGLLPSMGWSKEGSKVIITTNNRHVGALGTVEPITLKVFPFPE
ncbi:hypothetical protein QOZ80_5AG0389070 [Eleusine coracana subsp. coracana]|nr:hypothetical protein QOZ80_5AG0389070 [Eleusine coracana subsp. coracana]